MGGFGWGSVPDLMTPSVIPFWNRLTKCNHILKEKVKKFVMVIFFFKSTSGRAKSNLAKGGVLLAQIKIFFLQKWFLIGSSIRFQTGVTFEEKLYIITEVYYSSKTISPVIHGRYCFYYVVISPSPER